jgi:hypothetical protein
MTDSNVIPVVRTKDGAVYANSRDVAAFFGKRHDNVLRDIEAILLSFEANGSDWFQATQTPVKVGFGTRMDIIEANRDELEALGPLRMECIQTGGRPATAYYLNEEQALLVCTLARVVLPAIRKNGTGKDRATGQTGPKSCPFSLTGGTLP